MSLLVYNDYGTWSTKFVETCIKLTTDEYILCLLYYGELKVDPEKQKYVSFVTKISY